MSVIALIPARSGSRGIPGKNFRELGGKPLWQHAADCAHRLLRDMQQPGAVVLSTDAEWVDVPVLMSRRTEPGPFHLLRAAIQPIYLRRPAELASDTAAMIDVVKHAMTQIPGAPDDIWVLLQPTQPFRTPERVREAIAALTRDWDSVVTIAGIPRTHAPELTLRYCDTTLSVFPSDGKGWQHRPTRRQDVDWVYVPDGTAYVFRRRTVEEHGNIYGEYVRGIIIPPEDTCELDTPEDWAAVEARWQARRG